MVVDGEVMRRRRLLATIFEAGVERSALAVLQDEPLTTLVTNSPLTMLLLLLLLLGVMVVVMLRMNILVMMRLLYQAARSAGRDWRRSFTALGARRRRRLGLVRFLLKLKQTATELAMTATNHDDQRC